MSNTDFSPGDGVSVTTPVVPTESPAPAPPAEKEGVPPETNGQVSNSDGQEPPKSEAEQAAEASEAGRKLNERKRSYDARISELTEQRRIAEHNAQQLAARLAELEEKMVRPDPAKYDDPAKYAADDAAAVAAQYRHADDKSRAEALVQQALQLREETWSERVQDFAATVPDFEEVALKHPQNGGPQISNELANAIKSLEDGPAIAYHLGRNVGESRKLSRLSQQDPAQLFVELGRLSARLSSPPPKRVTQAPQPVPKVSGSSGGPSKDPTKMTSDEYFAWRKAGGDTG